MLKRVVHYGARFGLTMQVIKTVLAAMLSWVLGAYLFGGDFSYFAPLAAVLVVQVTIADSLEKGMYRVLGIVFGVILTMLITPYVGHNALGLGIVLLIGMGGATALKLNPQIISQIGVSAIMVMHAQQINNYALGRILETFIGAVVAVVISIVIRPENKVPTAIRINTSICLAFADRIMQLSQLAGASTQDAQHRMDDAEFVKWMRNLNDSYTQAHKSLKYNVVHRKNTDMLSTLYEQEDTVQQLIFAVSGINYAVHKLPLQQLNDLPIKCALSSTAECILTFGKIIRHATPVRLERIQRQLAHAYDDQMELYTMNLKYHSDAETHTEIGRLLSELHRIVQQIEHTEELSELKLDFSDKWHPQMNATLNKVE